MVAAMGRTSVLVGVLLAFGCGKTGSESEAPAKPAASAEPAKLEVECERGGKILVQVAGGQCDKQQDGNKIVGKCEGPDGSRASGECEGTGVSCTGTAKTGCCAVGNAEKTPECASRPPA